MKVRTYSLTLLCVLSSLFLTSCGTTPTAAPTVKKGDAVKVDYVGKLEDGTIFDASIQEYAKKSPQYSSGRTYEPLAFTVGSGGLLPAFEEGVVGMKVGDKKTIKIAAKNAYGEAFVSQDIAEKRLADTVTQEFDKTDLSGKITKTVEKSLFGEKAKDLKVGQIIETQEAKATIKKINGDKVEVEIENPTSPFLNKPLTVGTEGTLDGDTIKITKITADKATVSIENKSKNPFFGKPKVAGTKITTNDGQELEIEKVENGMVSVKAKNNHPLAGKNLIFDLTLTSINGK